MTPTEWAQIVPAIVALLAALTAVIRAEAAHRKLDDHMDLIQSITTSIAQRSHAGPGDSKV